MSGLYRRFDPSFLSFSIFELIRAFVVPILWEWHSQFRCRQRWMVAAESGQDGRKVLYHMQTIWNISDILRVATTLYGTL